MSINLMNGNSLELMKDIPDSSIDLIVSDPPYGMNFQSNYREEKYDAIENDQNLDWLEGFVEEAYRVLKENTAIYCFCSWHNVDIFKATIQKMFTIKNILVWEKNNTSMGDLQGSYAPKHEFVIFAHKGRRILNGFRYADIIKAKRTGNEYHPTEKPVDLLALFIKASSDVGEIVLDPFMGSGSTGVACIKTGRKFIGIELNQNYFSTAVKRINGDVQLELDLIFPKTILETKNNNNN